MKKIDKTHTLRSFNQSTINECSGKIQITKSKIKKKINVSNYSKICPRIYICAERYKYLNWCVAKVKHQNQKFNINDPSQ